MASGTIGGKKSVASQVPSVVSVKESLNISMKKNGALEGDGRAYTSITDGLDSHQKAKGTEASLSTAERYALGSHVRPSSSCSPLLLSIRFLSGQYVEDGGTFMSIIGQEAVVAL